MRFVALFGDSLSRNARGFALRAAESVTCLASHGGGGAKRARRLISGFFRRRRLSEVLGGRVTTQLGNGVRGV